MPPANSFPSSLAFPRRMAMPARRHRRHILPVRDAIGDRIGTRRRRGGTGHRAHDQIQRELDRRLGRGRHDGDWLQRSDVGDDRLEIVGRHRAVVVVRHQRKERAPVARHTFGNRAYELAVGPLTNAGRRDVRRVQRCDLDVEHRAAALGARLQRPGKARPVARAVTHDTAHDVPREIFAARDLLGRRDDFDGGRRRDFREREEEIRERDTSETNEGDEKNQCGTKKFSDHTSQSRRRTSAVS